MFSIVLEFLRFVVARKRYLMIPPLLIFMLFGLLMVVAQGSALAPLIYTLF
jgi:uncharacterized membrane protein YedE/YeeE